MWGASVAGPANQSTEDVEMLKQLWKPNLEIYGLQVHLFFLNFLYCFLLLQEFKSHHILSEMAGLRISRSKVMTFDIKVTIEVSCLMDFSDYPFDDHSCNFQVNLLFFQLI